MAAVATDEPQSQEQIVQVYGRKRQLIQNLQQQVVRLQEDFQQHVTVLGKLEKTEKERRCFRLVGDVMVDMTVGQVIPIVKETQSRVQEALGQAQQALQLKQKDLAEYQTKHKIVVKSQMDDDDDDEPQASRGKPKSSQPLDTIQEAD